MILPSDHMRRMRDDIIKCFFFVHFNFSSTSAYKKQLELKSNNRFINPINNNSILLQFFDLLITATNLL